MIRFFDISFSLIGLVLLSPAFLIIFLWIYFDSPGPVFYRQKRVGKGGIEFVLFKFRSMHINSDELGLITIGKRDSRITRSGYLLRKYKLDEIPQLINVFLGDMSLVGPRPEVKKYVELYTEDQRKVLKVKPGITDYASICFRNENELLSKTDNPEEYYLKIIVPEKIRINMLFIEHRNILQYIKIISLTLLLAFRVFKTSKKGSADNLK